MKIENDQLEYKIVYDLVRMGENDYLKLTDEELLAEKKKLKTSKIYHALVIGFLGGILLFGFFSWIIAEEKNAGFLIPMLIPVYFIYRLIRNPKANRELEDALSARNLQ